MRIVDVPINQLKRDSKQPRKTFDQEKIKDMAKSILTEGIINPIEIDKSKMIVTGEMRWRAAKVAGFKTVPCKVISVKERERFRRQVVENIHNLTMNPWDTAQALKKLLLGATAAVIHQKGKHTIDKGIVRLCQEIGMKRTTAQEYLGILEASEPIQEAVKKGKVQLSVASVLRNAPVAVKDELEKRVLAGQYQKRDEFRELVSALKRNPEKSDEILKAKPSQVTEIAPRIADQIRESYNPVNELSDIVDTLVAWLMKNPPDTVGSMHAPRIILNLSGAVDSINEWSGKINQKALTSNIERK